ncbi:hypothetical protein Tco_1377123 [Tanacetum coccineum]
MIEPEPVKKFSKKDQLKLDEEVAQRLQAEFDEQERIEREKDEANIALKETWDDIQAKIEADCLLAERLQAREQEELTTEERDKLFQQLLEKRRKHVAAKREEEKMNRPPTKSSTKEYHVDSIKRAVQREAGDELEQGKDKKQKVDKGRIVGIKRLHDDLEVTDAKLMLLVYKLLLSVFRVNVAITKLQLLKRLRLLEDFLLSEKG